MNQTHKIVDKMTNKKEGIAGISPMTANHMLQVAILAKMIKNKSHNREKYYSNSEGTRNILNEFGVEQKEVPTVMKNLPSMI